MNATKQAKGRGKDRVKRVMKAASIGNLQPIPRVRPSGMDTVLVSVYLAPATARAWRRLSPTERGHLIGMALEMRERGE